MMRLSLHMLGRVAQSIAHLTQEPKALSTLKKSSVEDLADHYNVVTVSRRISDLMATGEALISHIHRYGGCIIIGRYEHLITPLCWDPCLCI